MSRHDLAYGALSVSEMTDRERMKALYDENAALRSEATRLFNTLARITYCSAQCGDDAMKMREIAWEVVHSKKVKV
jgi:hypothetical protein